MNNSSLTDRLLTPPARAALEQLSREQSVTGVTPPDDMDVIAGLLMASRSVRLLQFGSFVGWSAVVMLDLAAQIDPGAACLTTIDTDPRMTALTQHYVALAGHAQRLTALTGDSTDPALIARLRRDEWDLIYLDTTHQYDQTCAEIEQLTTLCTPRTVCLLHDASQYAADTLDLRRQGGVAQALREWCWLHPRWMSYIFESPAWGQYGIGLLQLREIR